MFVFNDNRHNGNLMNALEELEDETKKKKTWKKKLEKPETMPISQEKDDKDGKLNATQRQRATKPEVSRDEKIQVTFLFEEKNCESSQCQTFFVLFVVGVQVHLWW